MDLLNQTRGFTLQHLRFLVIDEADRLLDQSFQDWLNKVLQATHSSTQGNARRVACCVCGGVCCGVCGGACVVELTLVQGGCTGASTRRTRRRISGSMPAPCGS
jgi:hypothetical protein